MLTQNIALIPHYLSMTVLSSSDRIMIAGFCGASFKAFYSVACSVASILNMLSSYINCCCIPRFYQKMRDGDCASISRVCRTLPIVFGAFSLFLKSAAYRRSLRGQIIMAVGGGYRQSVNGEGYLRRRCSPSLLAFRAADRGWPERLFIRFCNGIARYART